MSLLNGLRRCRATLAHWGPGQYFLLAALWFLVSLPFSWAGWGWASALSLPLLLLTIAGLSAGLNALARGKKTVPATPRAGFPARLEHPQLGRFPLSPYSNALYVQTLDWCGAPIQLLLEPWQPGSIPDLLQASTELMAAREAIDVQVKAAVAREMLDAYNKEWRTEPKPRLTAEAFLRTLVLESVIVQPDRAYEFLFQDGGLFDGHGIQVSGTLAQGPLAVELQG